MDALPARAAFRRGPWPFEAEEFLADVVLRGPLGLPLPRPKRPDDDIRTGLPPKFVLEVAEDSVRVLDDGATRLVESWQRGAVDAWVPRMDEDEVVVELRWPGGERAGRIVGDASPEARAVAELLAADTRVRRGVDPEVDAALRRLVTEILSDELARDRHSALAEQATLLQPDDRPRLVAGAARGFSDGILLLTDRALRWCSGGRKRPLLLTRDEIESAVLETTGDFTELVVRRAAGKTLRLDGLDPPDAGPAIVAAPRKGEPLVVERADIVDATATPLRVGTRLDLTLDNGLNERFESIEPSEQAEQIAAALAS